MDNSRSISHSGTKLESTSSKARKYLTQEEIKAYNDYDNKGIRDVKPRIGHTMYRYIYKCIEKKKDSEIEQYLAKKRVSPEYKAAFGEGESSTSAAAWSGGRDSTSAEQKTGKESHRFNRDLNESYDLNEPPAWN